MPSAPKASIPNDGLPFDVSAAFCAVLLLAAVAGVPTVMLLFGTVS
jgi:hypothetical protein